MAAKTPLADMTGRVCVVTGAIAGIGRATAERLAELGATLVLVCRRLEDGESVARRDRVGPWRTAGPGRSRRSLLAALHPRRGRADPGSAPDVHVLVNNAGLIPRQRETTVDGLEMQFAVNHLAYFLLTNLLLDRLIDGAPSRVVNVSSGAHQGGRLDFSDLQSERRYDPVRVYGRTKLANVLFTYELARRLGTTGVTANCLHPGVVATKLMADYMNVPLVGGAIARTFGGSAEKGAETSVYLAASREVEGVTGRYFVGQRETRSSPASYDVALQQRLWEESARLTALATAPAP